MDFVSRLKQYLESRRISVTQFADECNIPRPTASQLLAGRNKKVSDEMIGKIHQSYPDVSVVWLMFGEGDMLTGDSKETLSKGKELNNPAENKNYTQTGTPHRVSSSNYGHNVEEANLNHVGFANSPQMGHDKRADVYMKEGATDSSDGFANEYPNANPNFNSGNPREFVFSNSKSQTNQSNSNATSNTSQVDVATPNPGTNGFAIPSSQGKKVIGVVVYYDDRTYESFVPDENGVCTFMV